MYTECVFVCVCVRERDIGTDVVVCVLIRKGYLCVVFCLHCYCLPVNLKVSAVVCECLLQGGKGADRALGCKVWCLASKPWDN